MAAIAELNRSRGSRAIAGAELLSTVGWLSGVPADFRGAILRAAVWYAATAGTEFIHAGDERGGMFGIASGTAELSFRSEHPDTPMLHIARTGFWAGYAPLIGRPRALSLIARSEVVWALVPQSALERMLAENPGWWRWLLELSEINIEIALLGFADMTLQDNLKRAAAVLLRLAGCRTADIPDADQPDLRLSQGEFAGMAGMSRNTLNAVLRDLVARGMVDCAYRHIRVVDSAGLRGLLAD